VEFVDYGVNRLQFRLERLPAGKAAARAIGQRLKLVQITDLSGLVALGEVAPAESNLPE
jgi:hypothetical protein